jgi:nicotinate-nucleotide adenylyltransferase
MVRTPHPASRPAATQPPSPTRGEGNKAETRITLPPHGRGLRIGLLGGSFNPPHEAHRAISLFAMKRLGLDRVWWVVTPGNPLKDTRALPSLETRLAAAKVIAGHPRIDVTDVEAQIGTRYTVDTLRFFRRRCPGVQFVWLMGADILGEFHRWREWREIFALVPIAVIDRGGTPLGARNARAALAFSDARLPEAKASLLPALNPPAWTLLHGLKLPHSSTQLREIPAPRRS